MLFVSVTLVGSGCSWRDPDLKPYTKCNLGPDFQIFKVDGPVTDFAWRTSTKSGEVPVPVDSGYRVLVTYREAELFGNLKVERLPKAQFVDEKATLLSSLEFQSSYAGIEPKVQTDTRNGVTFYGIDRRRLEGGVLSTYTFFRDEQSIVVTLYLLNAEPDVRKFNTLEEYKAVRDKFLDAYSKCVAAVPAKPH